VEVTDGESASFDIHKQYIQQNAFEEESNGVLKERMKATFPYRRNEIIEGKKVEAVFEEFPVFKKGVWVS